MHAHLIWGRSLKRFFLQSFCKVSHWKLTHLLFLFPQGRESFIQHFFKQKWLKNDAIIMKNTFSSLKTCKELAGGKWWWGCHSLMKKWCCKEVAFFFCIPLKTSTFHSLWPFKGLIRKTGFAFAIESEFSQQLCKPKSCQALQIKAVTKRHHYKSTPLYYLIYK